ncbi:PQQ-dependent sugar dehydrogenase [Ichthyenterobacterium sp. W332]|uniref:PQQ-dependent sugar dehydrogenase n=1 Tax=Microcosmobacter mediterraneus TaxID=3075607 RepID=A0ABU2YHL7_9FLAO|nr:PQQ-dependent sugar dehydrogenase [Ichthyenterobacterium sp. W332]MDT0557517.1 PQQ-dependent sugar dehydrogenase [Ichthyenterobacterium sp. W332]
MKKLLILLLGLFCSYNFAQTVELEAFANGLVRPVNIKNAGDDRLFVVEQQGSISIVNSDGTVNSAPFLTITDRVGAIGGIGDERGFLGLAFHPNYATNGFFYVNYINSSGDTVVSRFSRLSPTSADPNSEVNLLTINQPFANHNGGDMAFGPDGYLYISVGDGGSAEDPQNNGQRLNTLLGKILRIDVDTAENGNNYGIPNDNPFVSDPNALDEIWAYGIRNAWKFSFDRANDDVWIADVGQYDIEEMNRVPFSETSVGLNYGWRCYEGNDPFNTSGCPSAGTLTFPVAQYSHFGDGDFKCSITGGYRYRGTEFTNMQGLYFFADYCSDEIGYLTENGGNWNRTFLSQAGTNRWTAFGEDSNGEIYVAGIVSGSIFKIIDTALSIDENDLNSISIHPNPSNAFVNFEFQNTQLTIIRIIDLQGKFVKEINVSGLQNYTLDVQSIAKGVYFAEIEASNGNSVSKKLIIN